VIHRDTFPPQQDQQAPVAEAAALGRELAQPPAELAIVGTTRSVVTLPPAAPPV
jgi:hypothetical protein